MYIKGFRAQTREFEQSILSTGKKRNQANSLNINELKNPSEKFDSKVVLKKSGRKTPPGTLDL